MEELEALDTAALAARLEEVTRSNETLKKENETLDAYLQRHVSPEEADEWADEDNRRGRKGKGRKFRVTALTIDQKLDIGTAELDAIKKEAHSFEAQSSRMIDALKAMLEQTDLRIASLKREAYEFKRDVVIAGENARTGKTMAEKVVKYYEDHTKGKDGTIDKLRLKNQALRSQLGKLEASLKQKDEVGDVLHYIDFHQLQIENKQYLAKIEEKNGELLRLKLSTGLTIQTLNAMKVRLAEVSKETSRLRGEIKSRAVLLARLQADNGRLSFGLAKSQEAGLLLARVARESTDLPTIMDYVELKALQANLRKEADSWKRKLEIMELAARQTSLKSRTTMGGGGGGGVDTMGGAAGRASGRFVGGEGSYGGGTTAGGYTSHSHRVTPSPMRATPGSINSTFAASASSKMRTNPSTPYASLPLPPSAAATIFRTGGTPAAAIVGHKGTGGFAGGQAGGVLRLGSATSTSMRGKAGAGLGEPRGSGAATGSSMRVPTPTRLGR